MNRHEYQMHIAKMVSDLPVERRGEFISQLTQSEKNPVALFGWNMWLGFLGIDRFVVGDVLAGILKLITLGGFGIWQLIDCFLIGNRARDKNYETAKRLFASLS